MRALKCYKHPERDAVGVCVVCGRGICEECAVEVAGKLYCKEDVRKIITEEKRAPRRVASITVASVLFYMFGIFGIIGSIFLLVFTPALAIKNFFFSTLGIAAGYWLWNSRKKGGILGIILCIRGILLGPGETMMEAEALGIPNWEFYAGIDILLNILLIVLIALGWHILK